MGVIELVVHPVLRCIYMKISALFSKLKKKERKKERKKNLLELASLVI